MERIMQMQCAGGRCLYPFSIKTAVGEKAEDLEDPLYLRLRSAFLEYIQARARVPNVMAVEGELALRVVDTTLPINIRQKMMLINAVKKE